MAISLHTRALSFWARLVVRHPAKLLVLLVLVSAVSVALAVQLPINTNQLDMISQELREVKDVKRVVDMVGGAGHLIIPLRSDNEQALKAAADAAAAMLKADKEHIRNVIYKVDVSFMKERAPLFMKTSDLLELKRRVTEKIQDVVKRASPFFFEIRETEPVELKVDDIVAKYRKVGKKSIVDDYYISEDRKMVLLVVKPMWSSNELGKTGELVELIRARFAGYRSPSGIRLVEDYSEQPSADASVVEYGFTGSYKGIYDDSFAIKRSLVPVSALGVLGVLLVLLVFYGRRLLPTALLLSGMGGAIVVSFGFAFVTVGELNMVSSILTGILMGLGIDFGIHFIDRVREELERDQVAALAVERAVLSTGWASFVAACGTSVAFLSLVISEFRGFSQFGLLAGAGVFITNIWLYSWIPGFMVVLDRRWPGRLSEWLGPRKASGWAHVLLERRAIVVPIGVVLSVGLAIAAPLVRFDYNNRALLVEGEPSVMLQDELNARFSFSSDPVAVFTPDVAGARAVWDYFAKVPESFATVDQVVSLFSFVPEMEQQKANIAVLKQWREELSELSPELIPEHYQDYWNLAQGYFELAPYGVDDIPEAYRAMFSSLPTALPENRGILTFIYPTVDLWDGRQILRFADEVENIPVSEGTIYHGAGLPILYAKLVRIVLHDAKVTLAVTLLVVFLVLLVDLRKMSLVVVGLMPLLLGFVSLFGAMSLLGVPLNFMNIVVLPIVLGYGVSTGVYLMHRFSEGSSPEASLRSVGRAVACSILTTFAGWSALLVAGHRGVKSMGIVACLGLATTLLVSFSIMPAMLQRLERKRAQPESEEALGQKVA